MSIANYRVSRAVMAAYLGDKSFVNGMEEKEINRLLETGLDYVLRGSNQEARSILSLHHWLRSRQLQVMTEIITIISPHYEFAVANALAWGMLDNGASFNGIKCDVDVLLDRRNANAVVSKLESAGHRRRVIDIQDGTLLDYPESNLGDPTKSFVGSVHIPFTLEEMDERTRGQITRLAGVHQPINIPSSGSPYLLFGIDAIHAYGTFENNIHDSIQLWQGIPVQRPSGNIAASVVRLYHSLELGHLKPNLIILLSRMISLGCVSEVVRKVEKHGLLTFLIEYIRFLDDLISTNILEQYEHQIAQSVGFNRQINFDIKDVFDSMEEYLTPVDVPIRPALDH